VDITNVPTDVMELFLPKDTVKWFDLVDGKKTNNEISIILEEKNDPPLPTWYKSETIKSKGFRDITITDFPIRGKKALLTFRRRSWKIEGHPERIKRDIKLMATGTTLEKEFADFLKK